MLRRTLRIVQALTLALLALKLVTGCGIPVRRTALGEQPSAAGTGAPAATTAATPLSRTHNPTDLILSTTTSTQDSGLLDALIPRFEEQSGYHVKTVAVGSGAAIALGQRGESDVVLAHAPESEQQFVASGAGINRQLVMYNDFLLVGPPDDPAQVSGKHDVLDALRTIAASNATFVSRGDNSGTHQLEQKLWKAAGITPKGKTWYIESGSGMGQTLQIADQRTAYTFSDRATYLAFKPKLTSTVAVEGDARLLNIYHVIAVNPARFARVNKDGGQAFIQFLLAPETQQMIGTFGRDKFGQSLFTPCAQNSCQLEDPDG